MQASYGEEYQRWKSTYFRESPETARPHVLNSAASYMSIAWVPQNIVQ